MNGITPDNLQKDGWTNAGTIDDNILWRKKINGEWYDLYYSGIDEDYILQKYIGVTDNLEKLYKLINK